MKVLVAVGNYPQWSETYVTTEIDFFVRSGIEVEVWAPNLTTPGAPAQVKVHRGRVGDAARKFSPDVIHCHYLHFARTVDAEIRGLGTPMTVRAHSFDFNVAMADQVAAIARVAQIYVFPHLARLCRSAKVVPLPVAYNSEVYSGPQNKDPRLVLRLSAAKLDKGLETFFSAAKLCPEHQFVLGVCDVSENRLYFDTIQAMNGTLAGGRVRLLRNVPWDEARALTRRAGIYLGTSDSHGHPFGMPISVAESLATGSYVLLRKDIPAAVEYLGGSGGLYDGPEQAAELIRNSTSWDEATWTAVRELAIRRAAVFADWNVLPPVIEDWRAILA